MDIIESETEPGVLNARFPLGGELKEPTLNFFRREISRLERLMKSWEASGLSYPPEEPIPEPPPPPPPPTYWEELGTCLRSLREDFMIKIGLRKVEEEEEEVPFERNMMVHNGGKEIEAIQEYAETLVAAMKLAMLETIAIREDAGTCDDGSCVATTADHYDALADQLVEVGIFNNRHGLYTEPATCTSLEFLNPHLDEWIKVGETESGYQSVSYHVNTEKDDVCMMSEESIRCSSHRAQYVEYTLDYAARFLDDDVRRVAIIGGGGDSMLLHEVLQYPDIERVVNLQLDQTVVRQSFKYLRTSPYFEDERVEWWFGDVAESLLALPSSYFGSFDLVFVDLSHVILASSIAYELDILSALAGLPRPSGIMVRSGTATVEMSEVFKYSARMYRPNLPILCDESFVMGSNEVDFFESNPVPHEMKNSLILEPPSHLFLDFFRDYRVNTQGYCDGHIEEKSGQVTQQGGVLMVVEIENATIPLLPLDGLDQMFSDILENHGLNPQPVVSPMDGTTIVVPMQEGYILARMWPEQRYCAMDIHYWGAFDKMESVRDSIVQALGGEQFSTYRLALGEMQGTPTREDSDDDILPPLRHLERDCGSGDSANQLALVAGSEMKPDKELYNDVLGYALTLVPEGPAFGIVVCGEKGKKCPSLDMARKHHQIYEFIFVRTCSDLTESGHKRSLLDPDYDGDISARMLKCEEELKERLRTIYPRYNRRIGAVIIDPTADVSMVKILSSIFMTKAGRGEFLSTAYVCIALLTEHKETWRAKHNFMDRMRTAVAVAPAYAAELVLTDSSNKSMELAIFSTEFRWFYRNLYDMIRGMKIVTRLNVDVRTVQDEMPRGQAEYKPFHFRADDYDLSRSIGQFGNQTSLGRQTLFQVNVAVADIGNVGSDVSNALESAVSGLDYSIERFFSVEGGSTTVALMAQGSAVAVWNGNDRVDLLLFTFDEDAGIATQFMDGFAVSYPNPIRVARRDEMPRGNNLVVNFKEDIDYTAIITPQNSTRYRCEDGVHAYKARTTKEDDIPGCKSWAEAGECESDPVRMLPLCPGACTHPKVCKDLSMDCPTLTSHREREEGECDLKPEITIATCPNSCANPKILPPKSMFDVLNEIIAKDLDDKREIMYAVMRNKTATKEEKDAARAQFKMEVERSKNSTERMRQNMMGGHAPQPKLSPPAPVPIARRSWRFFGWFRKGGWFRKQTEAGEEADPGILPPDSGDNTEQDPGSESEEEPVAKTPKIPPDSGDDTEQDPGSRSEEEPVAKTPKMSVEEMMGQKAASDIDEL